MHRPELDGTRQKGVEYAGNYSIVQDPGSVNPYSYPCRHVRASDLWCRRQSDVTWRSRVHQNDPYRGVRQISWILTDADIESICKTTRKSLANVDQLKSLLGADSDWADEWGQQIIEEISSFDANESSL